MLKIYIDRLKDDATCQIEESAEASLFDISENELKLIAPVALSGIAYTTNDHLLLQLTIDTLVQIPCAICNQLVPYPIQIEDFSLAIELDSVKGAIFDYTEEVRNHILLKIPPFFECSGGNCPSRKELKTFFKKTGNLPFSDLSL